MTRQVTNLKIFVLTTLFLFASLFAQQRAKFIFFFIADGMGTNQLALANEYAKKNLDEKLILPTLQKKTLISTENINGQTTDSAAAGTALATGVKTLNGRIGVDSVGNSLNAITYLLKENGYFVGTISSSSICHATPASFFARQNSRSDNYDIAYQIGETKFDLFIGGSFAKPDKEGFPNIYTFLESKGYLIADTKEEWVQLQSQKKFKTPTLVIQPGRSSFYDQIENNPDSYKIEEMLEKTIAMLPKNKSFFIMIEGSAIDWKCHENDAASSIHETLSFDRAVRVAMSFYEKNRENTLIISTTDHETGGMTLEPGYENSTEIFSKQKNSGGRFHSYIKTERSGGQINVENLKQKIKEVYGVDFPNSFTDNELELIYKTITNISNGDGKELKSMYGSYDPLYITLNHIFSKRGGVRWSTFGHSSAKVWAFAEGVGSDTIRSLNDNTQIAPFILSAAKVKNSSASLQK